MLPMRVGMLPVLLALLWSAGANAALCPGDCSADGMVSVAELVLSVGIALDQQPLGRCAAADRDGDTRVDVSELIAAVSAALSGCPTPPSPTASPTAPATASATATDTASPTAIDTASPTPTDTASPMPTDTVSPTATDTASPTATDSASPTASAPATAPATPSDTPSATTSASPTPTASEAATEGASPTETPTASPTAMASPRPNFIIIELDDTRFDGIDAMPVVQARLIGEGVQFHNSFAPYPLCCPSRASLFSGLYALHHGVRALAGDIGGAHVFRESGADQRTIAVWLRDAGYATGLFGKYLNAYAQTEQNQGPGGSFYVPPGWTRWRAFVSPERYGGRYGLDYRLVDDTGATQLYDDHSTDAQYSTDVLAAEMRDFIAASVAAGQPFLAVYTPYASHADAPDLVPSPAERHLNAFSALPLFRPPNWNEADLADKPLWLPRVEQSPIALAVSDLARQRAYETLLAVDEQLAATLDQLEALGVADHTLVLLTSDNGVSWGEHRLIGQAKDSPYEETLRVPMVARFPRGGLAPRDEHGPVLNVDIAPTLADLAGIEPPIALDGRSLRSALDGDGLAAPRSDFLIEHWRALRGTRLSYTAQPQDGDRLDVLYGPPRAQPRARRTFEFDGDGQVDAGHVQVPIGATADKTYFNLGVAVLVTVPAIDRTSNAFANTLLLGDRSPAHDGVLFVEQLDSTDAFTIDTVEPDYLGVRDVAGGFTYVEYEDGEVELYDLDADPWQLNSLGADPAYAAERTRLAARLRALAGE
jgi:arylsulfatase A-like enzyme